MMSDTRFYNFTAENGKQVYKDNDWRVQLTRKDRVAGIDTPIDITNLTFQMKIRKANRDSTLVLTLDEVVTDTDTGIQIIDSINGVLRLQISDTDTTATAKGSYSYDIIYTDAAGIKTLWLKGAIQFSTVNTRV